MAMVAGRRGLHKKVALAALLVALCLSMIWLPSACVRADDDEEVFSAEDVAASMAEAVADQAETESDDADEYFDAVGVLGADLACSACELIMDAAQSNMYKVEAVLKKEAKEKDEGEKKGEDEEEDKKEDKKEGESDDGEAADEEKKKDKKKSKKKSKKKDVKIDRKKVAETVIETICNSTNFAGVSSIGKYPGRRYSRYGDNYNPSAGLSLDSLNKASGPADDVVKACKVFLEPHRDWLSSSLVSAKKPKAQTKAKKTMCEKKLGVCKSAALGNEAEAACLAKALRAASLGEWDNALKHAKNCPSKAVKKKVEAELKARKEKATSEEPSEEEGDAVAV